VAGGNRGGIARKNQERAGGDFVTFSPTTFTAPSGAFLATAGFSAGSFVAGRFVPVYNPSVLDKYRGSYETKQVFQFGSDEWSAAIGKFPTRVAEEDFQKYGEQSVYLTNQVVSFNPHCSLGPLRGAAKPCVTAEVMSRGKCEYEFFNFQQGSEKKNHPRIIADVSEIILRRDPGEEMYRINITDTAKGGNGINTLVELLDHVKGSTSAFKHQRWVLDVNLLHDTTENTNIGNIQRVLEKRHAGFDIELHRYAVSNLIVEDVESALGFGLDWNGERHIFKPCSLPGQFLYRVGNDVRLIVSDNCYLTFEELYSQAITEYLLTSPEHNQVGVVWQEYQQKG
jgi:hypothetical protein